MTTVCGTGARAKRVRKVIWVAGQPTADEGFVLGAIVGTVRGKQ